ncbi:hypothetical protein BsIDN1_52400 [Bacillus safensis]|uniref:Uncharacterized protein n=1 Tax=Bacillus safensis TaxID=561879 RepID=A0A5S9MG61_BACIA|nr:hypothetical protein BsIDN1_52400 [Bacillus safensis]
MLTFETPEPSQPAIEMEVDIPAEEAALTENISAEPVEEVEAEPIEDKQEEAPAAAFEEAEPVKHDLQEVQLVQEAEIEEDQAMPVEQVREEQTASEPAETVIEQTEQQEQTQEVKKEEPKQTSPQPQRTSGQTSTVPFNVMMLKSDQRVQGQKKSSRYTRVCFSKSRPIRCTASSKRRGRDMGERAGRAALMRHLKISM